MGFIDGMASKLKANLVEGALSGMGLANIVDYIEKAPNDPEKLILLLVAYGIDLKAEKHEGDDGKETKETYNPIVNFVGGVKIVTEVQDAINNKDSSKYPIVVRAVLRHLKLIVSMVTIKQSTYMEQEFKDLDDSAIENPDQGQDQQPKSTPSSGETEHHKEIKERILKGLADFLKFLEKNMSDVEVYSKDLKSNLEKPFGDDDNTFPQLRKDGSLKTIENFMSTVVLQPGLLGSNNFVPEEISTKFHSISNLRDYMDIRLQFATSILGTIDNGIHGEEYQQIKKGDDALIETLKKKPTDTSSDTSSDTSKCGSGEDESTIICKNLTDIYKQRMTKLEDYLIKVLGLEEGVRKKIENPNFTSILSQTEMRAEEGSVVMGQSGMPMQSGMQIPMQPGMRIMPQTGVYGIPQGIVSQMRERYQQPMGIPTTLGPYAGGGGKSQTMLPGWMYGFFYPAQYEEKHSKSELKKKTLKKKRNNRKKHSTLKHKKHKSTKKETGGDTEE